MRLLLFALRQAFKILFYERFSPLTLSPNGAVREQLLWARYSAIRYVFIAVYSREEFTLLLYRRRSAMKSDLTLADAKMMPCHARAP